MKMREVLPRRRGGRRSMRIWKEVFMKGNMSRDDNFSRIEVKKCETLIT